MFGAKFFATASTQCEDKKPSDSDSDIERIMSEGQIPPNPYEIQEYF